MNKQKVLVIGASLKPERASNTAFKHLVSKGHEVIGIGGKEGELSGVKILTDRNLIDSDSIDTVTLYLSERNQADWEDFILDLKPGRIIFNPGAENPDFALKANEKGIETLNQCTNVMLTLGIF